MLHLCHEIDEMATDGHVFCTWDDPMLMCGRTEQEVRNRKVAEYQRELRVCTIRKEKIDTKEIETNEYCQQPFVVAFL